MGKEANNSLSYQLFGVNFLSDQEKRGSGYNSFKEAKDCDFIIYEPVYKVTPKGEVTPLL